MFNKLFTKILDSSIWLEPNATRIVWITLLAAMDETGYAHFSAIENLANRARVTNEEAEVAVRCFLAPDPNSGDPQFKGRRVERVPGGFQILNASKYRSIMNREIQREKTRQRVADWRAKKKTENWRPPMASTAAERLAIDESETPPCEPPPAPMPELE